LLAVLPIPWIEQLKTGVTFSRSFLGAHEVGDLSTEEAESFTAKLKKSGMGPVFDHMPYIPNLASPKKNFTSNWFRPYLRAL
jgi:hypothetical protein